MRQVGILSRGEELKLVEDQGRDPVGIVSVDSPRKLDELLELRSVPQFNTAYRDRGRTCHVCTSTEVGPEGGTPVVNYSKPRTEAEATAQRVTQVGGGAVPLRAMVAHTPEDCGRIDLLVNTAEIPVWRPAATS